MLSLLLLLLGAGAADVRRPVRDHGVESRRLRKWCRARKRGVVRLMLLRGRLRKHGERRRGRGVVEHAELERTAVGRGWGKRG